MASIYAFCVTKEDAADGTKCGWAWAKENRSKWIQCDDLGDFLCPGYNVGEDYIVHDGKAYAVKKSFCDVDTNSFVLLGVESMQACDVKTNFD